jgi:hypothetical protein
LPPTEVTASSRPRLRRSNGIAAAVTCTAPQNITSMAEAKSSPVIASAGPTWMMPALSTNTSSRPNRVSASATTRRASSAFPTSAATVATSAPVALRSASAARRPSAERAQISRS